MSISPKIAPKLTNEMVRILYDTVIRDLPDHRWKIIYDTVIRDLPSEVSFILNFYICKKYDLTYSEDDFTQHLNKFATIEYIQKMFYHIKEVKTLCLKNHCIEISAILQEKCSFDMLVTYYEPIFEDGMCDTYWEGGSSIFMDMDDNDYERVLISCAILPKQK